MCHFCMHLYLNLPMASSVSKMSIISSIHWIAFVWPLSTYSVSGSKEIQSLNLIVLGNKILPVELHLFIILIAYVIFVLSYFSLPFNLSFILSLMHFLLWTPHITTSASYYRRQTHRINDTIYSHTLETKSINTINTVVKIFAF